MPAIPRNLEEPAVTDEEVFLEAKERLRIAMQAESENRAQGMEALEFRDGHQWPQDLYNERSMNKRPALTLNHTNTFCRRVVNNMRQQRPRIKVHPVGDGADIPVAQVIEGLIRHIEINSQASVAYDTAGESAVNIGWGYMRVLTEYVDEKSFDQEIKIGAVRNTFTGYIDPASVRPDGSDMDWFMFTFKMKRADYNRKYKDKENIQFIQSGGGDDLTEWETKEEIRLCEYFRINKVKSTLYRLTNGMDMLKEDMRTLQPELNAVNATIAKDERGREISRPSYRRQVERFVLNGREVVEKSVLPGKYIPVVRCEGNVLDLNGRVRRKGMIKDLMDPARMYNVWRTYETEILALSPKAPFIGPAGFMNGHPEWATANQTPHSALEYEPTYLENPDGSKVPLPAPKRSDPIQVPAGFVQAAQGAQQDLMAIAGMPHEPNQDTPGTVVSGLALKRREALSDIGHFQYYDNQTQAIAQVGRICLDYIPVYYSTARMQRIVGEDGVPSMVGINQPQASTSAASPAAALAPDTAVAKVKNDLTVGRYDVVMDTGPGYETKRLEGAEAMIDLLKTPLAEPIAKVGADLVVRNMDFAGSGDLADRLMPMNPQGMQKVVESLPKEAKGIVTAMQQQMAQLQQALKEAQLELKFKTTIEHGWMQVEREKTKEKQAADSANNATKQFDTASKVHGAIAVAEIKAGADILTTHVDAKYDKDARKDELAAAKAAEKSNGAAK